MLATLLILAILTIGAVSAVEDTMTNNNRQYRGVISRLGRWDNFNWRNRYTDQRHRWWQVNSAVVDNSVDESVTSVNGTLILADIDIGDVVRKKLLSI